MSEKNKNKPDPILLEIVKDCLWDEYQVIKGPGPLKDLDNPQPLVICFLSDFCVSHRKRSHPVEYTSFASDRTPSRHTLVFTVPMSSPKFFPAP